jgi:hypothetical protein
MTMKKCKEVLQALWRYKDCGYSENEIRESLDMAIKALEQTSALDKARAEIAAYGSIWVEYVISGHTDHDIEVIVKNVLRQAKEQVLTVIDKYRVESEDKA